jgi:hypothetical protein
MKLNKMIMVPLLIILVVSFSGCITDSSYDTYETSEVANDLLPEEQSLPIINMTNITLKKYNLTLYTMIIIRVIGVDVME